VTGRTWRRRCASVASVVAATFAVASPLAVAGTGSVPFTDSEADGYVGLCDLAGNNVTSGSVDSTPFAWKAVSSVAQPSGYRGNGMNTNLTVYQARKGILPQEWSGDELTGASVFKNAKYPTAVATYKDLSLRTILREYPPQWNGLYELRMSFGRLNYGDYSGGYPATVIQVTGDRWHVVQGGIVNCGAAKAASTETIVSHVPVLPRQSKPGLTAATAAPNERASGSTASARGSASPGGANGGLSPVADQPISEPLSGGPGGSGSSAGLVAVLVVAALVVLALAGLLVRRRLAGSRKSV
jgi:hypothetical protein